MAVSAVRTRSGVASSPVVRVRSVVGRVRGRLGGGLLNVERLVALVVLAISVLLLVVSIRLGVLQRNEAAPGTFPTLVAGGLVVLSVLWLVGARRPTAVSSESAAELVEELDPGAEHVSMAQAARLDTGTGAEDTAGAGADVHPWRLWFVIAWSALALPVVDTVGMAPVLWIYLAGLLIVVAGIRWWKALLFPGIVIVIAMYGAYQGGIYLPDPYRLGSTLALTVDNWLGW